MGKYYWEIFEITPTPRRWLVNDISLDRGRYEERGSEF
jgi:hypothetical protein